MLGWHISIYPVEDVDLDFPTLLAPNARQEQALREAAPWRGTRIAVW
jgi:hypothetical protein